MDLQSAVLNLTTAVGSPTSTPEAIIQNLQMVMQASADAGETQINQALSRIAPLITQEQHPVIAATIGVVCGALVESGGDPSITFDPLIPLMCQCLPKTKEFVQLLENRELNDTVMQELAQAHPEAYAYYAAFDRVYLPIIAMTSRSKAIRSQFSQQSDFTPDLQSLESVTSGAGYLLKMWRVLDDMDVVVLHPGSKRGYIVRISGIADNFQLHVLLADAVLSDNQDGRIDGKKPSAAIVAAMRDAKPHEQLIAEGSLNLVNYTALKADKTLDAAFGISQHWIWNEGVPADILPFEGQRVILLQQPPYVRTWNAQRLFDGMVGELTVQQKLSSNEVDIWLERIARANHGGT